MKEPKPNITIEIVDAETYASTWSGFGDNLFVNPLWVAALSTDVCKPLYLHILLDRLLIGKIAGLMIEGNLLQGKQLYFYSSPVLKDFNETTFQQVLNHLASFAKKNGFTRLSVRPWDQDPSVKPCCKCLNATSTNEYVIDVTKSDFACKVSGRIMKNIKKAQKGGATIRISTDAADLDVLLSFLDCTRNRRISKFGSVYSPYYVFNLSRESILALLKNGMGSLVCADLDGKTYSVLLLVTSGERVCCLLKGSSPEGYKNGLSSFVDFETVRHLNNNGVKWLNLGPELISEEGKGLNQYKEGITAVATPRYGLYTYYLVYPYKLLNPLMVLGGNMANFKPLKHAVKAASALFSGSRN
jgi:hypothetical protein